MPLIASCSSLYLLVLLSKYQMIQMLGKSSLLLGFLLLGVSTAVCRGWGDGVSLGCTAKPVPAEG